MANGVNKQTIQVGGGGAGGITSGTFEVDFGNNTTNIYTQELFVPVGTITGSSKPVVQFYDTDGRDADESEFVNFVSSIVSVTNGVGFTVQITDMEEGAEGIYNFSYQF